MHGNHLILHLPGSSSSDPASCPYPSAHQVRLKGRQTISSRFGRLLYKLYERRLLGSLDQSKFPRHVGVILDGHRRYARAEGLASYTDSYRTGMERFEDFVGWTSDLQIPAVTGWVLSKENLTRPSRELDPYFEVLLELFERLPNLGERHDLSIRVIGSLDLVPDKLQQAADRITKLRPAGSRVLTLALGYGGRQEIVDACRDLVDRLTQSGVTSTDLAEHISAEALAQHMYSSDLPDPDLVIRTSGESRLSGFLLWQSAYAEFVFVDVYWPACRRVDFLRALRDYTRRSRRFGR